MALDDILKALMSTRKGFGARNVVEALNPDPEVTNRMSMLPVGNYDDGSVGIVWPQSAVDAKNAFGRFHRGEAPQPQDAVLAGLVMGGGLGVPRPAGALAANSMREAQGPLTARVYRGASNHEQWPPTNPRHNAFWASDNPEVASSYASEAIRHGGDMGSVTPADITFQNPMVVNAKGQRWDQWHPEGQFSSDELLRQARNAGHDGLVIQQTQDGLNGVVPSATTYAALKPGTVKSATTGETLFSNPPDAAPVGVLPAMANAGERQPIRAYHGTGADIQKFKGPDVWAATDPNYANHYAENALRLDKPANVMPLDIYANKIFKGDEFGDIQRQLGEARTAGYDAIDWGDGTYQVIQPGTIKSATSGETLFANPPSAAPAGLLATREGEDDDLPPIVRALLSNPRF
jgi:hypothetical protein